MSRKDEILNKLIELSGLSPDVTRCLMFVDGKLAVFERPSQAPDGSVLLFSNQWFVADSDGHPISKDPKVLAKVAEYIDQTVDAKAAERRFSSYGDQLVEHFAK